MLRFQPWAQRTPKGAKSRNELATKNAPYKVGAFFVVASEGFEPPKAEPSDLQTDGISSYFPLFRRNLRRLVGARARYVPDKAPF